MSSSIDRNQKDGGSMPGNDALARIDRASTLHPLTPVRAFEADETGGPRIVGVDPVIGKPRERSSAGTGP